MITLTLAIFALLAILFLLSASGDAPEGVLGLIAVPWLILGVTLFVMVLSAISERVNFGPTMAKIEQLRKDVARVNLKNAEDVYGQAAAMNQTIVEYQAQNKMFFYDQFIPDGWDNVKLIEIPEQ